MPTATQSGIVNAALAELGSTSRISSIDDAHGVAPDAKAVWDQVTDELLAEHPWNWAIARAVLNPGATPEHGYAYGYALPADCLRWLPWNAEDEEWFDAVEEGGRLLTDFAGPVKVRYISGELGRRMARWSPSFVRAMTFAIAAALAEPVTQDESIKQDMEAKAEGKLRRAKRRDGLASGGRTRNQVTARSDWLQARERRYHRHLR
jgi:hypothetical protein